MKTQLIVAKGIAGLGALWFLFNLLILTFIFFIASFLVKKNYILFFQIISLTSYIIQYSGINYRLFIQYSSKIRMSIGNLIETFPLAIGAFFFSSNNLFQLLSKYNKTKYIFFCFFVFYLISNYDIFAYLKGNSSPGIKPMVNSIILFSIFYLTPFENINSKILNFITPITKYTQGIYCLNSLLVIYMRRYFEKNGTFIGTIILYIIDIDIITLVDNFYLFLIDDMIKANRTYSNIVRRRLKPKHLSALHFFEYALTLSLILIISIIQFLHKRIMILMMKCCFLI